jgi:hypothetical protein
LDRVFTDNKNFETSCIICGDRKFIAKDTEKGMWLSRQEQIRMAAGSLAS